MIHVRPVTAFRDNYIWLIGHSESHKVAIVDPGDAGPVLAALTENNLTPIAILITHHHPDHVGGVTQILEHYSLPVYGPAGESIPGRSHPLREGGLVELPETGLRFRVLDVPGHTSGHIAYHGEDCLFIGDTLFLAGCGKLFEGTPAQMRDSLKKILSLGDETRIYCGHEYTLANLAFARTVEPDNEAIRERQLACEELRNQSLPTVPGNLAMERATNPFLRVDEPGVIASAEEYAGHRLATDVEVFAAIRDWKDRF